MQPACGMHHTNQQHDGANQHHHALHGIVEHAGTEAAEGGVQGNGNAEDQQAVLILNACCRLQQACAADKLHRNRPDESHQQTDTGNPHHRTVLVARLQHVIESNGVIASRQNSELLTEYPQRQPDRRHLDQRQQHPAQPVFIGGTRPTDKRTGADVGRRQRHGQHKAAHRAAAEEVFAEEGTGAALTHGIQRQAEYHEQVKHENDDNLSLHLYPPAGCRGRQSGPSASTAK